MLLKKIYELKDKLSQTTFFWFVFFLLYMRLIWFVEKYSVNILYWDQWDFLKPLFKEVDNLWIFFSWQHGPHRQGLGGLIQAVIYPLSNWNVRFEVFIAVFITGASAWLAVLIKKRLWGKLVWTDISIPLIYYTLLQYGTFIGTINLAHGVIPVFLVTLSGYLMTLKSDVSKSVLLSILVLFTTYTGFAIFSGISIIIILFSYVLRSHSKFRLANISALLIAIIAFLSFLHDYKFMPAVSCYKFPHDSLIEYFTFSASQFGKAFGIHYVLSGYKTILLSAPIFGVLLYVSAFFTIRFLKNTDQKNQLIFYFSSFTILFIVFTAIGRVCLGPGASMASRYIPYSLFGILAIYFGGLQVFEEYQIKPLFKTIIIGLFIFSLFLKETTIVFYQEHINWLKTGKVEWVECYLETQNIENSDSLVFVNGTPESNF